MYQLSSGKKLFVIICLIFFAVVILVTLMHPSSRKIVSLGRHPLPQLSNNSSNVVNVLNPRVRSSNLTVSVLDVFETSPEEAKYECVHLRTKKGYAHICIYPTQKDRFISASLKNTGSWEPHLTSKLEQVLENDRNLNFIDVGANLGVYSIIALRYNRRMLAVDANPENAKHIRRSVKMGEYENMATIVVNAISDNYDYMKVKLPADNNVGGAHVYKAVKTDDLAVKSVYMDDLLEVINFNRAVMKIDVESSEPQALSHSSKFFSQIDIPYVFMEWEYIKDSAGGLRVKDFLESRGYSAHADGHALAGDHKKWPYDIMWIRTKPHIFPAVKPI
ncbi:uncharacterized protein LOC141915051 [Tubulanus polymorphus]|uniref:uncharacterized protein LOC141915051 n=1 Tax=Tubulanus polymorphus TaxID=672921 RepID=UPI003DA3FE89